MAITVNTNIASLNAQRNLSNSSNELSTSIERLSSGLRVNSAKDDAAGLAISQRLTSQINGLTVATRNANDGISLAQTAEGALGETTKILQRVRDLAVQASNASLSDADRNTIQTEVGSLVEEIDRIAASSSFNGRKILDGSFGTDNFQIGANKGETIAVSVGNARTTALGASDGVASGNYTLAKTTSTAATAFATTGQLTALGNGDLSINSTNIRATVSGDDTTSFSDNKASAIAVAAAINASSKDTGVNAIANKTTLDDITFANTANITLNAGELVINGVDITGATGANETTFTALINTFSDQTGVVAEAGTSGAGFLKLTAVDGRNITIAKDGSAAATSTVGTAANVASDVTLQGTVSLYSNKDIEIGGANPAGSNFNAGTTAATTEGPLATDAGAATFEDLATGDLVVNGYSVDFSVATTAANERSAVDPSASAQFIALAINNTEGLKDEVSASATTVFNFGKITAGTADDGFKLTVNGTTVDIDGGVEANDANGLLTGSLNAAFVAAQEASSTDDAGQLVASVNSAGELIITANDGRNIDVDNTGNLNTASLFGNYDTTVATDKVAKGTIALTAKDGEVVSSIDGAKQALAGIETQIGTIANLNVSTFDGAQNAISAVDAALDQVNSLRADLGAVQNRLTSTIANLENSVENFSATRSRIVDADFASETAALSKNQILQQAASAMLTQANASSQIALSLLQG